MRPLPTDACLGLIHRFEQGPNGGFAPTPYRDPADVSTIGYGHAIFHADDPLLSATLSQADADNLALSDLTLAAEAVCSSLGDTRTTALTDNQYAALIDFTFNEGPGHFASSTLRHLTTIGDYANAANEFGKWIYGGNPPRIFPGLVIRRRAEKDLWQTP